MAAAFEGVLGFAILTGLATQSSAPLRERLTQVGLIPAPPPPPPPPPPRHKEPVREKERAKRPEGAASPPNLKAQASEIKLPPPPPILLPPPPPVTAAPLPSTGAAPSSGNAPVPGPGTGSGGEGTGTGSGSGGNGPGGGGNGYGRGRPPRQIRGRIKDKDYPESAARAGIGGTVWVRYTVQVDGHAINCRVTHSSGNADLDATTCRLIEGRFGYRPAQDEHGRPVQADVVDKHEWIIGQPPPGDEEEPPPPR